MYTLKLPRSFAPKRKRCVVIGGKILLLLNDYKRCLVDSIMREYENKSATETDFTDDLKSVDIPVLVLHGEDDQIVPFAVSAMKSIKLLKHGKTHLVPWFSAWNACNGSSY